MVNFQLGGQRFVATNGNMPADAARGFTAMQGMVKLNLVVLGRAAAG